MTPEAEKNLISRARDTLQKNDLGGWTRPTPGLYPHQWFWDSCFIAIGLQYFDMERAKTELRTLIRGQWENGMFPHIIFSENDEYHAGPELWQSEKRHPAASRDPLTTAITNPPMLAEAVLKLADNMEANERAAWLKEMYPPLVKFHEWIYHERDPHHEGLVFLVHSWESGQDNKPSWMDMVQNFRPAKVRFADRFRLESWYEGRRKDTKQVPANERIRTYELMTAYHIINQLKRLNYDYERIVRSKIPLLIDVEFNSILIRANTHVQHIAEELGETLPAGLVSSMSKAPAALQTLHDRDGRFFSRDFRSRQLVKQPGIEEFLPLYSGAISKEQAAQMVERMQDTDSYWLEAGLASAPRHSPYFRPRCYWQGPVWVNINWLLIDGLQRYGYHEFAETLRQKTLAMVENAGMYEYFSPLDGKGAGASPFSWTAALTVDLIKTPHKK